MNGVLNSAVPLLVLAAVLAAGGQVLFKLGAGTGGVPLHALFNPTIGAGLLCYGVGTVLWIVALSRTTLTVAYPFTALTFVLVYLAAVVLFHEKLSVPAVIGSALVWVGLIVLLWSQASRT